MFIDRDDNGNIKGVYARLQYEGQEWIADDDAELLEFFNPTPTYADLRRAEYPPCADYLDGIVKGDTEQVQKYIDDCLAVKAKYPKPE